MANDSRFRPLSDHLIVREIAPPERKSAGGIALPDNAKTNCKRGVVVAVGPGKRDNGELVPIGVEVGETILFASHLRSFEFDGEWFFSLKAEHVEAVLVGA